MTSSAPTVLGLAAGENPSATFTALDRNVPVLMLPVRMETRVSGSAGARLLKIRIFPDQIHVDDHASDLTADEEKFGRQYWQEILVNSKTAEDKTAARNALTGRIEPRRAAWVAAQTRPKAVKSVLQFPTLRLRAAGRPAQASALPERWAAIGYVGDSAVFVAWGKPVVADPKLSPADSGVPLQTGAGKLSVDQGIVWLTDYDRALKDGMAITVELAKVPALADRKSLDKLVLIGVRKETAVQGAQKFTQLLLAHTYTDGADFVAQGTPTNNTDQSASGWSSADAGADSLFAALESSAPAQPDADTTQFAKALGLSAANTIVRSRPSATGEDQSQGAMNRVLWPVMWGQYLDGLLTGVKQRALDVAAVNSVKSHFIDRVRGGACLPVLRVGSQPYGILPVRRTAKRTTFTERAHYVEDVLLLLRSTWSSSLSNVPRVTASTSDDESTITGILGSLPHPAQFLLRGLERKRKTVDDSIFGLVWGFEFLVGDVLANTDVFPQFGGIGALWYLYLSRASEGADIDDQIEYFKDLRGIAGSFAKSAEEQKNLISIIDFIIKYCLEPHRDRQPPLGRITTPGFRFSGVLSDQVDDPAIVYSTYDSDEESLVWNRPLVEVDNAGAGATTADYLRALKQRIPLVPGPAGGAGKVSLSAEFIKNQPLLYQLLDSVIDGIPPAERALHRQALDTLASLSKEELELRLRETLGLAANRLDAWITSLATERLDEQRAARPSGLQLGSFGWVENLAFDSPGASQSQGFIHAPSLNHAATAAVLRAGWNAHGSAEAASPLNVDLQSERIQLAAWLFDGIRQGQTAGDLLGCRFERDLHDSQLDMFIDSCRRAVLQNQGITTDPRGPVDGLELAELYEAGKLAGVIAKARTTATPALPSERDRLSNALLRIRSAIDAAGDAAIFESVHQLLQGNTVRATASLDAISTGEALPPELRSAETPRAGVAIEHRLVLMFDGARTPPGSGGWKGGARATLESPLEAWVQAVLGDASKIQCSVAPSGETSPQAVSVADLSVSALDLIAETPVDQPDGEAIWSRRITDWVRGRRPDWAEQALSINFRPSSTDVTPMADLLLLARAVRNVLWRSRSADGRDLNISGGDIVPGFDAEDALLRAGTLERSFRTAADALKSALEGNTGLDRLRGAMMSLAGFGLAGGIPSVACTEAHREELRAQALLAMDQAGTRIVALDALLAKRPPDTAADSQRIAHAGELVKVIFGAGFPFLPRFKPSNAADLAAAFGRTDELVSESSRPEPAVALNWLQQVAKVRPEAALLDEVANLSELVGDETRLRLRVAQLPNQKEGWVARTLPKAATGGRLAVAGVEIGAADAMAKGQPICGLCVDSWVERVPASDQLTGLTFHFDSPSSRPPQTLLLAVPPKGEAWSLDLLRDTIAETLDNAKLRAVGPEHLSAFGHHLPAIFPPKRLSPGTQPRSE